MDRLGRKVFVLYVGRERRKYSAHLEIARHVTTPDSVIRALCRLIEGLPAAERRLWNRATVRSFSIGVQAGTRPNSCDFEIHPATVKAVSDLDAQIVFTVAAPEQVRVVQPKS